MAMSYWQIQWLPRINLWQNTPLLDFVLYFDICKLALIFTSLYILASGSHSFHHFHIQTNPLFVWRAYNIFPEISERLLRSSVTGRHMSPDLTSSSSTFLPQRAKTMAICDCQLLCFSILWPSREKSGKFKDTLLAGTTCTVCPSKQSSSSVRTSRSSYF